MYRIETSSPESTQRVGKYLAGFLKPGDCIPLIGEIGAGKTCFVQGIAKGLHVPEGVTVKSPSYIIINRYQGDYPINHVDLYRLGTADELDDFEFDEIMDDRAVTLIEWPCIALPRFYAAMEVHISWDRRSEFHRILQFATRGKRFNAFFKRLDDVFSGD